MTADDGDCFETCQGHPGPVHPILGRPLRHASPVTADVQRELAEILTAALHESEGNWNPNPNCALCRPTAAALLPTVQALIADAEKRAAAGALRNLAVSAPVVRYDTGGYPVRAVPVSELLSAAAALDPSGAAEGAGR